MPLAGRMKLKTFMALVGFGGVTLGGLAWALWPESPPEEPAVAEAAVEAPPTVRLDPDKPETKPEARRVAKPDAQRPEHPTEAPPAASPWPAERGLDRAIARFIGKPISGGKKKDITSGQAAKVNVYMDDGHSVMNRAKVDLDRDERWDEKWTFLDGGGIQRQVAPKDDEAYTQVFVWDGQAWVPEG
ncbi:MAG: hypothetical protein H6741_30920 [Alphaproteobacteria bacterium]|nr:hypothetical protein [Alphaproteobacteria bacterium]